jgi:hypothetical protein
MWVHSSTWSTGQKYLRATKPPSNSDPEKNQPLVARCIEGFFYFLST